MRGSFLAAATAALFQLPDPGVKFSLRPMMPQFNGRPKPGWRVAERARRYAKLAKRRRSNARL